jgi:endogenous inhibitor of DNA gyrase (YacG/DUF329 family)
LPVGATVTAPRCPTCRKPVADRRANRAFPFCSDRCRLLDLGKWFDGQFRIPGERAGDGEAGPATDGDGPPES